MPIAPDSPRQPPPRRPSSEATILADHEKEKRRQQRPVATSGPTRVVGATGLTKPGTITFGAPLVLTVPTRGWWSLTCEVDMTWDDGLDAGTVVSCTSEVTGTIIGDTSTVTESDDFTVRYRRTLSGDVFLEAGDTVSLAADSSLSSGAWSADATIQAVPKESR